MTSMIESLLQLELWDAEGERAKDAIVCVALRPLYKISAFQSSKQGLHLILIFSKLLSLD